MAIKSFLTQRDKIAARIAKTTGEDTEAILKRAYALDEKSGWQLGTLDALRMIEKDARIVAARIWEAASNDRLDDEP